jgi:hypothetical protein
MNEPTRTFRRPDTGEEREFRASSHGIDTTTQFSAARRDAATIHFYVAADGTRIDRRPDGTFQEKWGTVWVPVDADGIP